MDGKLCSVKEEVTRMVRKVDVKVRLQVKSLHIIRDTRRLTQVRSRRSVKE